VINWNFLENFDFGDDGRNFNFWGLLKGVKPPGYVDSDVRKHSEEDLDRFLSDFKNEFEKVKWRLMEKKFEIEKGKYSWGSDYQREKVFVFWEDGNRVNAVLVRNYDGHGFVAVQLNRRIGLITGCSCAHPFVSCNELVFGNSDGSSSFEFVMK